MISRDFSKVTWSDVTMLLDDGPLLVLLDSLLSAADLARVIRVLVGGLAEVEVSDAKGSAG